MYLPREGGTRYSHYKQAEKSGATVPELNGPAIPQGAEYIFNLWREIYKERDSSFSLQTLKIRDILTYCEAFNIELEPFEIKCILLIDEEFVKADKK